MEITNELRAAAFAAYYGSKAAQYFYGIDPIIGEIVSVEQDRCVVKDDIDRRSWCYLPICKLQLHRLSDITDEHAKQLIPILSPLLRGHIAYKKDSDSFTFHNPVASITFYFNGRIEWFNIHAPTKSCITDAFSQVVDKFREMSFNVPFRGIDLIESGIAEYVIIKTTTLTT